MSSSNHLKNIVIVGASGNVGGAVLEHLNATKNFNITIITRPDSEATFPSSPSITVKKGAYDDADFLASAFSGQDAVVLALSFMAMGGQAKLIEAAARAGVKWILPTEYAGDGLNETMVAGVPLFQPKVQARKQIEDLAKQHQGLSWIGVATNPFTEFCLQRGLFGIDFTKRTATLASDSGRFNTSTLPQVGLGITRLLSLPITNPTNPRASLSHYANNFVYISSFATTQRQLLAAVQRATDTTDADWTLETNTVQGQIEWGRAEMAKGNMLGGMSLTFAYYIGEGLGGDYQAKAVADAEVLGLKEESEDEVVRRAVQAGAAAKVF